MENAEAKWYILHTYSGYEAIAQESLNNMIENNNLQDYILDIKVPTMDEIVEKNGKRKVVVKRKFPTYVFIKLIYTNHIWYMVTQTRGVTGFVGPQGKPLPLTADEVKRMGLEIIAIEDFDIKVDSNVRINNGPLEGFIGVVEEVSAEKQKVKVSFSMFGRLTTVDLDFSQVEKL